jgi:hypothetical protein
MKLCAKFSFLFLVLVATAAAGVTLPTATASHLVDPFGNAVVSGRAYEGIFYQVPNISIGASGDQEVIVEIWGIKGGITSVSKQAALNGRYCFV